MRRFLLLKGLLRESQGVGNFRLLSRRQVVIKDYRGRGFDWESSGIEKRLAGLGFLKKNQREVKEIKEGTLGGETPSQGK